MSKEIRLPGLVAITCIVLIVILALPGAEESGDGSAGGEAPAIKRAHVEAPRADEAKRHQARECISKILRGDAAERFKAVAVLKNLGEEGLSVLRETFAAEDSQEKREAAAFGLAVLGNDADKDKVAVAFLETGGQPTVLMCAAAAELQDPGLVTAFLQLRASKDWRVRQAVAMALKADRFLSLKSLMPLLADGEPRVRAAAERTLVSTIDKMDKDAVEEAVTHTLDSGDPLEKQAALRVCGRVDQEWTVSVAMRSLRDSNAIVRADAMRVLERKGDGRASGALAELMHNGQGRRERVRAASTLGSLGRSPQLLEQLAKAANGDDPIVALAASRSLVAQRDTRAIEPLLRLREIRKNDELDVDDEDAMLLRGLSDELLELAQGANKRRPTEDWKTWWERVRGSHQIPARTRAPSFPENH